MAGSPEDALYQLLGDRIREVRASTDFSQGSLARDLGVHRVSIVNIEKGKQRAPLHLLWRIAEKLGVELVSLIPHSADIAAMKTGVQLDGEAVAQLEAATKGDLVARRQIESFIRKARARMGS